MFEEIEAQTLKRVGHKLANGFTCTKYCVIMYDVDSFFSRVEDREKKSGLPSGEKIWPPQ